MRVFLFLCFSPFAFAGDEPPDVTLTEAVKPAAVKMFTAAVGAPIKLAAPKGARWELATEAECYFDPADGSCTFSASKPGRYMILAHTGGPATRIVVVVGGEPVPPGPIPPPVPDTLTKALTEAFALDGKTKPEALKLASLYRAAAVKAKDASVPNYETLAKPIADAASTMIGSNLMNVRKVVSAETKAIVGDAAKPFTVDTRKATADLFDRAAAVLEELGK